MFLNLFTADSMTSTCRSVWNDVLVTHKPVLSREELIINSYSLLQLVCGKKFISETDIAGIAPPPYSGSEGKDFMCSPREYNACPKWSARSFGSDTPGIMDHRSPSMKLTAPLKHQRSSLQKFRTKDQRWGFVHVPRGCGRLVVKVLDRSWPRHEPSPVPLRICHLGQRCKLNLSRAETSSRWAATAGSDVVQSGRPIFDDFFQHLWPYIGNNTANVVFQMVKRLWLIRIDQ
ncbi:hypothetical protein TNCV_4702131 [Trichonephila clavipes]|uniref:Uncharacterized protein n=1 Tax=Trichonephila clavipes TaxID=2585209 RepID=A0A8X6WGN7_TRICX|nr:hypothetical protein TNCV_4702131 [Trichonephila clavipes]